MSARGLRVVLAHDLSEDAERALGVVASAAWPPGSVVRIVTSSSGIGPRWSSFATLPESRERARALRDTIVYGQAAAVARLAGTGLRAETAVLSGRPARSVVEDAAAVGADLVIVGAEMRPLGSTSLLGSVSTEIAERAPCAVLIARVESFERVLLATDGSAAAAAGAAIIADWPLFAESEIRIVAVAQPPSRYAGLVLSDEELVDAQADEAQASVEGAAAAVEQATARIMPARTVATAEVRTGSPGPEIIAAAREWPADVVVLGSTGESLLRRLFLGSVARTVLQGVHSSILVSRAPAVPPAARRDAVRGGQDAGRPPR